MVSVHFLYMQDEWVKLLPAVPSVGDRVTFGEIVPPKGIMSEIEYEVSVIHWFMAPASHGFPTHMEPYVSLMLVKTEVKAYE